MGPIDWGHELGSKLPRFAAPDAEAEAAMASPKATKPAEVVIVAVGGVVDTVLVALTVLVMGGAWNAPCTVMVGVVVDVIVETPDVAVTVVVEVVEAVVVTVVVVGLETVMVVSRYFLAGQLWVMKLEEVGVLAAETGP